VASSTLYISPDEGGKKRSKHLGNSDVKECSDHPTLDVYTGFTSSQLMTSTSRFV